MATEQERFGRRGEWYVVAQFSLGALIGLAPLSPWDVSLAAQRPWLTVIQVVGLGALLVGIGVFNAGLLALGWRNLTPLPYPKEEAQFVGRGAYRWVRHPIYSGVILGALGWALLFNSLLALVLTAVLFLLFDAKSRQEEAWLRQKFPEYAAYQQQVRKLIPWVY